MNVLVIWTSLFFAWRHYDILNESITPLPAETIVHWLCGSFSFPNNCVFPILFWISLDELAELNWNQWNITEAYHLQVSLYGMVMDSWFLGIYIFTGRNEVVAKVIFLHLSVIHSVHMGGGCLPQYMLGYHTHTNPHGSRHPHEQTPPRSSTSWKQKPPLDADSPGALTPPGTFYTPKD